jgi:very-short-patch-repair endonuclease
LKLYIIFVEVIYITFINLPIMKRLTAADFIERAKLKHGELYIYDKSVCTGSKKKIIITCKKHGDFNQEAGSHLSGVGCPKCAGQGVQLTTVDFIERAKLKHGELYVYEKSLYTTAKRKLIITCKIHGDFNQQASSHLSGVGCPKCANSGVQLTTSDFVNRAKLKHGELYVYDKSVYTRSSENLIITCKKHGDFNIKASSHLRGVGCPNCSKTTRYINSKPPKGRSLAESNPNLAKLWHKTKNGDLTPSDVFTSSKTKVWWKCENGDDHEWYSSINNSNKGSGCPICSGNKVVNSNCLKTVRPDIAKYWHATKNGDLTPSGITYTSSKKVWWKCDKVDDHEWYTSVQGFRSCSVCNGKTVVLSNCLKTLRPDLAKQWHPTKNGDLTPYDVTVKSGKRVWWKCEKADDHEWISGVHNRSNGAGCHMCTNRKIVKSNCLATTHPKIAQEWHKTKNGDLTPYMVSAGFGTKIWWTCDKGLDHEYQTKILHRTHGSNCPFCTLTPQSRQELTINFELIQFFKDINPKGFKTRAKGKLWSIDIYIPQLKLGIEFDGSYWHKDKRALDKLKTEQLEEEGFEIFRVREEPLKRIFDDDIMSKQPFNAKQVVNDILTQIMSRYTLDAKKIAKIESYIAKKELQNEKGLDKYIDMILTEKAEKKNG